MAASCTLQSKQPKALKTKATKTPQKSKPKNILCGESVTWPKPSQEVEDSILSKLSEVLRSAPNIFKPVKNASKADQEGKRKIRAQLDLGTNCVARALDGDRLACVLVSGKTTPASALDPVISTAHERGCPLLCLNSLSTTLAKVTKSKTLPICIGFKKLSASTRSDFLDVITLVQDNTSVVSKHGGRKVVGLRRAKAEPKSLPESMRPVSLDAGMDAAVREDLKRIFSNAALKEGSNKMWTAKDRKRKKDKMKKRLKQYYKKWFHLHFESGKRLVTSLVGQGRVQMVFVIPELIPVLMLESPANSLLCVARDQDCPVLAISNLATVIATDTTKVMAVLAIKKESCLPMGTKSAFAPVIETCVEFLRTAPMPSQDMDVGEEEEEAITGGASEEKENKDEEAEEDYSFLYVRKQDSVDLRQKALRLREERDKASHQMAFGGDFISFGGGGDGAGASESAASSLGKRKNQKPVLASSRLNPKKMLMDTTTTRDSSPSASKKPQQQTQAEVSGNAFGFISLSSSSSSNNNMLSEKPDGDDDKMVTDQDGTSVEAQKTRDSSSGSQGGNKLPADTNTNLFSISRAGDMSIKTEAEATSAPTGDELKHAESVFSATDKLGKSERKKRHGQDGFLSLTYNEANIHTMVANPGRKKKRKGKK